MNDTEAHNGGNGGLRGLPPGVLRIIVCVAGTCVGAYFGSFEYPTGTVLGAVGGLIAGLLWPWIMLRRARTGFDRGRLVGAGAVWGIVVGLLATAILHGGLIALRVAQMEGTSGSVSVHPIIVLIAAGCAGVGGAITGAVCGAIVPVKDKPD